MLKFIIESYSFKRIVLITIFTIVFAIVLSYVFDKLWEGGTYVPIITLEEIYSPPKQYDNREMINIKLISNDLIVIEGNKKLKIIDKPGEFGYYDTLKIYYPDTTYDITNRIYFQFENSNRLDSIYLATSKSNNPNIYYKQIFFSSVKVNMLNKFSEKPELFRINASNLVNETLLHNNDTLINSVLNYFNSNISNLGIAECGRNSLILSEICQKYDVPCRTINLQGGDRDQVGYDDEIGYPLHVVCEIYSSKYKKWYVIDPTFGLRFYNNKSFNFLNAVEICNQHTFNRDSEIEQDSILLTKNVRLGKDYFKYYENVVFTEKQWKNKFLQKIISIFYSKFNYYLFLYSNNFPVNRNSFYYVGVKSLMYIILLLLYIHTLMFVFLRRLFLVKNPKYK
ncbi:MAG: hypothetical protein IT280_06740 [Ignavibacteria bacterium]|nr:hypothetical protein [Ignavibacteria bacterium]